MLLSELHFWSLLAYSPHGSDAASVESRKWTYKLKREDFVGVPPVPASRFFVQRLAHHLGGGLLAGCFAGGPVIVPMPGHAPTQPDGLWVPDRLCTAMVDAGLVPSAERWLERDRPVERSRSLKRPSASEHAVSLRVLDAARSVARVLIVDDVITTGASGLAAASLLRERLPHTDVTVFAMVRTLSDPQAFRQMLDPCAGIVSLRPDGSTRRSP